jgi:hypothetical protein
MTRAQVLQQLAASKAELATRFGVTGLALFGSVVRDAARADSDVDVLVSFDGPATSASSSSSKICSAGRSTWSPTRRFAQSCGPMSNASLCMSDGVREWRFYVDDMIAFAEKVLDTQPPRPRLSRHRQRHALEHCRHRRHCALADAARGAVGAAMIRVHADPRGLAKAHAVQVARRVARSDTSRGRERKSLSLQRFPNPPPQYDIVLL